MKKSKIFFTWQKNENTSIDFQGGFFKQMPFGGKVEFYLFPAIIFYKWTVPKLDEELDYEMKYKGLKIFLIGEYYLEIESVTRIFSNN